MRGWITSLVKWCIKPLSGGFAELDQQIMKFRQLKESYSSINGSSNADRSGTDTDCTDSAGSVTPYGFQT